MSDPEITPVVAEPEARASVEALTEGMAEQARSNGILPPMREIEKFAREVTHETIARHEERFRNGVPEKAKPEPVVTRLDKGPLEDHVGTVTKLERPFDPVRFQQKRGRLVPLEDAVEEACVRARLSMLLAVDHVDGQSRERYPEWAERVRKAWSETAALARNLELDAKEQRSAAADAVLKLLDESDGTFGRELGPWRHPKESPRVIVARSL